MIFLEFEGSQYSKIFWLEAERRPKSEAIRYHIYGIFDYETEPNFIRFQDALQAVVNNHYNLRSTFKDRAGKLIQVIYSHVLVKLEHYGVHNDEESEVLIQRILHIPFNLEEGPLFRFACIHNRARKKIIFVPVFHHIVIDGTQFDNLMKSIEQYYHKGADLAVIDEQQIPDLQSYIAWESQRLKHADIDQWIQKLEHYPLHIDLPYISNTLDNTKPRTHAKLYQLDDFLYTGIQKLAKDLGCSIFDIFKTVWALLISIYADQDKLVITYPFNTRRSSHKRVKGAFLNSCLFPFERKGSFSSHIYQQKVHKRDIDSYYVNIIDILSHYKGASFSCAISQADLANKGPILESKPGYQFSIELGSTDLCLFLNTEDFCVQFGLIAVQNLFDKAMLDQLSLHLCILLANFIKDPHQDLTTVSCLTPEDYHKVHQWNRIQTSYPLKSIVDIFEEQVLHNPKDTAIIYHNQTLNYQDLNTRANQLARCIRFEFQKLIGKPLEPDTLIPLYMDHGLDFVISMLAILKAGGAYVPIDPSQPIHRIERILSDLQSIFLITKSSLETKIKAIIPAIKTFCIDHKTSNYEDNNNLNIPLTPSHLAYVMYTSGTTGQPKGVMIKHGNIVSLVKSSSYFRAGPEDTFAFLSDIAFDAATFEIFGSLLNGSRLYIPVQRVQMVLEHQSLKKCLLENRVTVLWLTKSLFDILFTKDPTLFASLNYLLVGGEALTKSYMEALWNSDYRPQNIINGYGPTENTTFSCTYTFQSGIQGYSSVPIGKPLANRTAYVLSKDLQLQPIGAIGTLFVGGAGLAQGYLNQPELTKQVFIKNPFQEKETKIEDLLYNTQDRVRWLSDGNLEYLGRRDTQVKLRGYRIELQDIESHILAHPQVQQAIVILREIENEKYLIAYYVSQGLIEGITLRTFLANLVPHYMIPHIFVPLKQLPLTTNGKIDEKSLPIPKLTSEVQRNTISQQDFLPLTVHKIWSKVLLLDTIDFNISFFDLGGDSLKVIKVKQMLEEELSISISVVDLFQYTTLHQLIYYITNTKLLFLSNLKHENALELPSFNIDNPSFYSEKTEDIAIIGMSCRLPKAITTPEAFWNLLINKKSTLCDLSDQEIQAHSDALYLSHDNFVKRASILENTYSFDANFFGYSTRDAELMDPQQRHFLECAWQALEHSGNVPDKIKGEVGVFASQGKNWYYDERICSISQPFERVKAYQAMLANEKDFLATRISFKFDLKGPSITVQTGCSSSLVAINMACDNLRSRQCHMAIAGGVSLFSQYGYLYQEGMIESPDGYCRPFDAQARGTIAGSGAGIVILKRLSDAIADKDKIYAVIKGYAINNDGSSKIGYTAPSVAGQRAVIQKALQNANLLPNDISYIEAHGTATPLGDPIELTALHDIYSPYWNDKNIRCSIGSVKSNIGHTDAAAGVLGLIKTTLMLQEKKIPPTLYFQEFNPEIAKFNHVFQVPNEVIEWNKEKRSRFAAISAFGIGGTNAHTILQEYAPEVIEPSEDIILPDQDAVLIPLSSKTKKGLNTLTSQMREFLKYSKVQDLQNIAFTSQQGRTAFSERGYIIARNLDKITKIDRIFIRDYPNPEQPICIYTWVPDSSVFLQIKFLTKLCQSGIIVDGVVIPENHPEQFHIKKQLALLKLKSFHQLLPQAGRDILWISISPYKTQFQSNPLYYHIFVSDQEDHEQAWLNLIGWLWSHGILISWENIYPSRPNVHKISIPTYPFEQQYYVIPKVNVPANRFTKDPISSEDIQDSTERELRKIWITVLGIAPEIISNEVDFFDLGGDSMSFIDIFAHVKKSFSLEIILEDMIQISTFGAMHQFVQSQQERIHVHKAS